MTLQNYVDRQGPVVSAQWLNFIDGVANSYAVGDNSGITNAYVLDVPATKSFTLAAGAIVRFRVTGSNNSGPSTLNVGGTGAKALVNPVGQALTGGEVRVSSYTWVEYDSLSDVWRMISIYPQESLSAFTPSLSGLTTPGTQTYAANGRVGFFSIAGKKVSFTVHVQLATKDAGAAGGVVITGLPIAAKNTAGLFQAVTIMWGGATLTANFTTVTGYIAPAETQIRLTESGNAGNVFGVLTMAMITGTAEFMVSGSYFID